ncbi:MAG: hypothetical protein MJE77_26145 [Proteobacteria bacterium]|nr:hypothetical protein [Pseudomonadota bacterium]
MNVLQMNVTGDDQAGWTWSVQLDGKDVFRTKPLVRDDLAEALFSIQRDNSRENELFCSVPDDALLFILDGYFFGELNDVLRASAEEQTWAKHLVSPAVPTVVGSRMFLIGARDATEDRLLISDGGSQPGSRIAAGRFDELLRSARARLEQRSSESDEQ